MRNTLGGMRDVLTGSSMAIGRRARAAAWIVGVGVLWGSIFGVLSSEWILPLSALIWNEAIGAHARLYTVWERLIPDPRLTMLPLQAPLTVLITGAIVYMLVRFARAPMQVWIGVLIGVLLTWAGALWWSSVSLAITHGLLGGYGYSYFIRYDVVLGVTSILGAWLGAALAARRTTSRPPAPSAQQAHRADAAGDTIQ